MWDFIVDSAAGAEATTNIPSITLGEHTNTSCVAFHPGPSNYILAVSGYQEIDRRRRYSIKLWNYWSKENPNCIATLQGHTNEITSIRFHPSMPLLVSGSRDSKVKFWCIEPDVAKTSCCKTLDYSTELDSGPGLVTSIEFGPNHQNGTDSLLATGTFSGMLRLYDIEDLRPILRGRNPFYLTPTNPDMFVFNREFRGDKPSGGKGGNNKNRNTKRNRHKLSRKRRRRTFRKKRKSHNRR
jgi:WD40 repeat protein